MIDAETEEQAKSHGSKRKGELITHGESGEGLLEEVSLES